MRSSASPSPSPPPAFQPESTSFAWRARSLVLFGLGGLCLVSALALRSSAGVLLAAPLLLAPASAWATAPSAGDHLELTSSVEEDGEDLLVRYTFRATTPAADATLEATFQAPEGTVAPEGLVQRFLLRGEEPATVVLRLRPLRPLMAKLETPKVCWRDPLGLGELRLPVRSEERLLEHYPPEVRRFPRMAVRRTTLLPGEVRSRTRSSQGEFAAIRPYAVGDPRNSINWWASARRGQLASNEFLAERSGEFVLVLDTRPSFLPGDDDQQLLGVARAAALGLARYLLREKTRVGVAVFGEFVECLPLRTGSLQRHLVEQWISRAKLAETAGPVERLAVSLRQSYPPGTQVLLISPLVDRESLAAGFLLRRRGFPCLVLSPSPTTFEASRMDLTSPEGGTALRLLRVSRRRQLAEAWQSAPVVEWEDFTSLAGLVAFLRSPPPHATGRAA